jgi:hypothetical protein
MKRDKFYKLEKQFSEEAEATAPSNSTNQALF